MCNAYSMLSRCPQTGQQDKADRAVKITVSDEEEDEAFSLAASSEEELRETSDEDLIDSSCHSCVSQSSSGIGKGWHCVVTSAANCSQVDLSVPAVFSEIWHPRCREQFGNRIVEPDPE